MTMQLGASLALTGPEREYGAQTRAALELAVEDAGVEGIALRVEDDGSDSNISRHAADALVLDESVFAVIGPMNSWTAAVQAPVFAAAGLVQITHSASSPELPVERWPTMRRLCPVDDLQGDVLARLASDRLGAARVAAIGDGTGFATPLVQRFLRRAAESGLSCAPALVFRLDPRTDREPRRESPAGLDSAAATADVILIAGLEAPCRAAALELRRRGCRAVFLGTDAIKPTRVLVTDGADDGPYLTCSCIDAAVRAADFHRRMRDRCGRHDSIYTVEAYDAARLAIEALRAVRQSGRNSSSLRASVAGALSRIEEFSGQAGTFRFDDAGELANPQIGLYHYREGQMRFLGTHDEVLR